MVVKQLISKCIAENNIEPLINYKLRYLLSGEDLKIYEFILDFYHKYYKLPDISTIKEYFPNFEFVDAPEPVEYYLEVLKSKNILLKGRNLYETLERVIKRNNYEELYHKVKEIASDIDFFIDSDKDVNYTKEGDIRFNNYLNLKRNRGLIGIEFPFEYLNIKTGGMRKEQLIVLCGAVQAGKTWFLLYFLKHAWEKGAVPLIISRELSIMEISERLDSLICGIPHTKLMKGELTTEEERMYKAKLEELKDKHPIYISGDEQSFSNIDGIISKIERYKPSIVFIDGAYIVERVRGEKSWETITQNVRMLKRAAKMFSIPIVCTVQFDRKTAKKGVGTMYDVGYSKSFYEDSDMFISLHVIDTHTRKLVFEKFRQGSGEPIELLVHFDPPKPLERLADYDTEIEVEV